jgi:hypothetical protein
VDIIAVSLILRDSVLNICGAQSSLPCAAYKLWRGFPVTCIGEQLTT